MGFPFQVGEAMVPQILIRRRALWSVGWACAALLLGAPACRTPDRTPDPSPSSHTAPRDRRDPLPDSERFFIDPPRRVERR